MSDILPCSSSFWILMGAGEYLEYFSSMATVWESSSCCVIRVASNAEAEQ